MLQDLKIKNGEMSLEFDPLNTTYTVTVNSNIDTLEFAYNLDVNTTLEIIGNNLNYGINIVILKVIKEEDEKQYTFKVYKKKEEMVNKEIYNIKTLDLKKDNVPYYIPASIACTCFLIILLTFTLFFKKKKKNKF